MTLVVKSATGDFKAVPAGLHQAVLFKIIDCGTQLTVFHNVEKYQRKLMIFWECPKVRLEIEGEDKPGIVMSQYTLSLHEKARLRQMLEQWRGKKFTAEECAQGVDLSKLIGRPCQLNIIHNEQPDGRVFANVDAVLPWPEGQDPPELENEPFIFDVESWEGFESLSDKMQQHIAKSLEGRKREGRAEPEAGKQPSQEFDDDIPF